ncbi:MAG: hypothetical protein JSS10_01240 [Verrucomicrobia bacterium]|nr:hypothetical protein [Verrucomicrobiota bacterium]
MTATIQGYFQTALHNLGSWNWSPVALGFRAGLLPTQLCLRALEFVPDRYSQGSTAIFMKNMIPYFLAIQTTYGRVQGIARTEPSILPHLNLLYRLYVLSLFINAAGQAAGQLSSTFIQREIDPISRDKQDSLAKKKLSTYIFKSTPFVMLLTNIALSLLELRSHKIKATVSLAVTSVVLINYLDVMPWSMKRLVRKSTRRVDGTLACGSFTLRVPDYFAWYLDPGLRIPLDLIAMYYANNRDRFAIVAGWVDVPRMQRLILFPEGGLFSRIESVIRSSTTLLAPIAPILRNCAAIYWRI